MAYEQDDVVILGAGPAGYVAGIRAAQLGLRACIVEKDRPGGVCLNVGCIPSKALIHQADILRSASDLEAMGVSIDRSGLSYAKVVEKSRQVTATMTRGVEYLLKKNKVRVVKGRGTIVDRNTIALEDGTKVRGKNLLIATGSRPKEIPGFAFDGHAVLSSDDAVTLTSLPARVLVLGGGAIGCEFAHIFSSFGSRVTLVEMEEHLLPLEDAENVAILERAFRRRGITVLTGTRATELDRTAGKLAVTLRGKGGETSRVEVEKVLLVVGRIPNTSGIGLENVGLELSRGFIPVGDYYETEVAGLYAAGDVVNSPLLAHVASKEAEVAVEHMAHHPTMKRLDPNAVPGAIYAEPQIASFGLTEKRAREEGIPHEKATFPFRAVGRAVATDASEGQVKVLVDPRTREILGAHIVGDAAPELLHELLLARTAELLPEDIARMIHVHPTLSEAVMESMRMVEGWAVHL